VSVDDAFAKLTGRQATPEQRERLYRLRDALGLRDNDAFWSIVMALEYYDSFLRQYPAQFAELAESTIESARAALSAAAQSEAAHVQRVLSAKVAETSVEMARRLADRPIGVHRVTLLLAAVVAFGALCVHAGYHLASTDGPLRSACASELAGAHGALASVFRVPAGWMIFALLVPAAVHGIRTGWDAAMDPSAEGREKAVGWCLVVICVAGGFACAALLVLIVM